MKAAPSRVPGTMKLSDAQVARFWSLWGAIVRARNWDRPSAEAERLSMLQRAGFRSLKDVDRRGGFDRVLAELGRLQDNLQKTVEIDDRYIGEARRIRHVIRNDILVCLKRYVDDTEAYLDRVLNEKQAPRSNMPLRRLTLEDLDAHPVIIQTPRGPRETASPLSQLLMTLNARLHRHRQAAGESIHTMRTAAGLSCECSACRQTAAVPAPAPVSRPVLGPEIDYQGRSGSWTGD